MFVALNCIEEQKPGEKWQKVFNKTWPFYKKWFLIEGHLARRGYLDSASALKKYMPELFPIYQQLCELAGGGDLAARYLSMYCPPPYMAGCTQLAWTRDSVALMRNYDYDPRLFEGVMLYSNWLQPIIGISECNCGLIDGMNANGLAASLTFGGRKVIGEGFGIPIVMRYILETCNTVKAAVEKLKKIPVHMSYNITLVDKEHDFATVYLSPDREIIITKDRVGANHQQTIEWHDYAAMTETKERTDYLYSCLANEYQTETGMLDTFFQKPLYCTDVVHNFITLYTSVYKPLENKMEVHWPEKTITQSFDHFTEQEHLVPLLQTIHQNIR
jgi:predicted choloylglycine hydrolase